MSQIEKSALSHGLNFALPPRKLDYCSFLSPFEKAFSNIAQLPPALEGNTVRERFRDQLKTLAFNCFENYKPVAVPKNSSSAEVCALRNLAADSELVVCKPDKGNGIVLLNKSDYTNKMESLISDTNKFRPLNCDLLKLSLQREDKLSRLLLALESNGSLTKRQHEKLHPSGSKPGILYGLPKVHKPNVPLRPILSAIGTFNYNVAKFLVPLLHPLTSSQYTLQDSFEFANFIQSQPLSSDLTMASFDEILLFTQIPLKETIKICIKGLFPSPDACISGLSASEFQKLLETGTLQNHFLFIGKLYDQLDGVAMGSPLAPSLANAFLCFHERKLLKNCPQEFRSLT